METTEILAMAEDIKALSVRLKTIAPASTGTILRIKTLLSMIRPLARHSQGQEIAKHIVAAGLEYTNAAEGFVTYTNKVIDDELNQIKQILESEDSECTELNGLFDQAVRQKAG